MTGDSSVYIPLAPLVIGVTGHRDLRSEDLTRLRERVREVLEGIRRRYPHTPLILLSSLAEGADRLVAQKALDLGAQLVAVLPMEEALYEADFAPSSRAEFRELLQKAKEIVVLPSAAQVDEIGKKGSARNAQYALAGAYIARHSRVVLALWDGRKEDGTGGTAQIVDFLQSGRFKENGVQAAFERLEEPFWPGADPLDAPEAGMVVHIITPRQDDPMPDHAFEVVRLAPEGCLANEFFETVEAAHARLDIFNSDLRRFWRATSAARRDGQESLFPETDGARRLPDVLLRLREQQAAADTLASYFQTRTRHTIIALSSLVFLAAAAFAHHSTLAPPEARRNPWSLALYLVFLALAAVFYLSAVRRNLQNKFLDYRAVAEGLRVQFYWSLAGLRKSAADHYLRWQENELEWIRHALRPWSFAMLAGNELSAEADQLVRECWIGGQARYFQDRAPRKRHLLLVLASARNVLLLSSLSLAAFEVFHQPNTFEWLAKLVAVIVAVSAMLLMWSLKALLHSLRRQSWKAYGSVSVGVLGAALFLLLLGGSLWGLWSWLIVGEQLDAELLDDASDAWRMVAMGLAAVAGALVYGYADTMALSDESKQYERMERIFASAQQKAAEPGWPDRRDVLLEALGKEALAENGEWVLMHRERPVELPHA